MRQILHISDVHFGPRHSPKVAEGVLRLVEERSPDLVVISGDLTQRAKPEQFRAARQFVDRLTAPSLVVPGNHDVPAYRFWERLRDPFGAYKRYFSEELEPVWEDEELLVVGLNTAYNWTQKEGRVTRAQLDRVKTRFSRASAAQRKIIVAHHQLVPAPRFGDQRVIRGAFEAVDTFLAVGVELVLSGHLHQSYVSESKSYYPDAEDSFLVVHSGTTTSARGRGFERKVNTCNWIALGGGALVCRSLWWDPGSHCFLKRREYRRL